MPHPLTLGTVTRWTSKGPRRYVRIRADEDEAQFFIGGLRRFTICLSTGRITFRNRPRGAQQA